MDTLAKTSDYLEKNTSLVASFLISFNNWGRKKLPYISTSALYTLCHLILPLAEYETVTSLHTLRSLIRFFSKVSSLYVLELCLKPIPGWLHFSIKLIQNHSVVKRACLQLSALYRPNSLPLRLWCQACPLSFTAFKEGFIDSEILSCSSFLLTLVFK